MVLPTLSAKILHLNSKSRDESASQNFTSQRLTGAVVPSAIQQLIWRVAAYLNKPIGSMTFVALEAWNTDVRRLEDATDSVLKEKVA